MGQFCVVIGCKKESFPGCGLSFHRIPATSKDDRNKWSAAMGISGSLPKSSIVCSLHFKDEDYLTESKKKLRPGAVPSQYLKGEPVAKDPMIKTCFITKCTSASVGGHGIAFFKVEDEIKEDETKRKLWIKAFDRPVSKNAVICGSHFKPADFILDTLSKKYVLRPAAVPSVFSPEEIISTWSQHEHMLYNTGSSTKTEDTVLLLDATSGITPYITVTSSSAEAPPESAQLVSDNECGEEDTPDAPELLEAPELPDVPEFPDDEVTGCENTDGVEQVTMDTDTYNDGDKTAPESLATFACNVCLKDIVGFRYSCVECVDYDMCSTCEARGEHALHFMLRVPTGSTQASASTVIAAVRKALTTTHVKEEIEDKSEEDEDIQPDPLAPSHTDLDIHDTQPPCLDPYDRLLESKSTTIDTESEEDIPIETKIKEKSSKGKKRNLKLKQDESSSDSEDTEADIEEIMNKYLKAATEKKLLESDLGINTKAVKRRRLLTKVPPVRNPRELSIRSRRYASEDD